MRDFLKKNSIFIIASLFAVCIVGLIALAATGALFGDSRQDELAFFGQSGTRNLNPPASCTVNDGDSIYDLAEKYRVPVYDLVIENRITGDVPLTDGSTVLFPRYVNNSSEGIVPSRIGISADKTAGKALLSVRFRADINLENARFKYVWDLGNNRFSFDASAEARYFHPGIYHVRLAAVNETGRYVFSNTISITVNEIEARYQGLPYISLERVGDLFSVEGRLKNKQGGNVDFDEGTRLIQTPALLKYLKKNVFQAIDVGFSRVRLEKDQSVYEFYLFVSPFPARLSVEPEYDWYKTQYQTGMYGNCGPAGNASAIKWATGEDVTIETIRKEIGMPYTNGAVDYKNLVNNLDAHHVKGEISPIRSPDDITGVIDRGGLVLISFNCGTVKPANGDKRTEFVGRYYPDATGHYLLIKGYSLDKTYFVVYDAIPGEWKKNEIRYLDGMSQIGRNRFFRIDEVMLSIGGMQMIVVYRD